ncbi:MAG: hypothetical protein M1608_05940 [Candidatus Omnitrophica bacterium]|nr:hypothetical protein [Candidatus Omnitrophota bacterium]
MKNYKTLMVSLTALLTFAVTTANALTEAQVASVKKAFDKVRVAELAAQAAQMVAQAAPADKESMAVTVTKAAIAKKPAVAVSVVSAIAAVAPETAPAVAAAATAAVKDYSQAIVLAAIKAAPDYSEQIVQAVSTAVPSEKQQVARVRTSVRSADTPVTTGTITITPGPIRGLIYTPTTPPVKPPTPPVVGFDLNRYSSP